MAEHHGGKRKGAGRKRGEPSRAVRIPESMLRAAQALQAIGRGRGTERELAEVLIAVNLSRTQWGGVIGAYDMDAGKQKLRRDSDRLRDTQPENIEKIHAMAADLDDLEYRIALALRG